jgi:tRNA dimethylallyltransferase
MSEMLLPAVAILGPTASGKSSLALSVCGRFQGEIISCDALQVYRLMDIGTAKPSPAERLAVPHHLLDLRLPGEDFSAGDYLRFGREALHDISKRGSLAVVAGGTGFYFRALVDGLFEGPGRSEELRARMKSIADRGGLGRLYRAFSRADPECSAKIASADRSRILRAYEVYLLTGKPMSWWQQRPCNPLTGVRWLKIALDWQREELYERINSRVEKMFENGFVEEVQGLQTRYSNTCHAFKAIGYRQIVGYLEGRWTREEAMADTQQESRRYAKRQLTWFRSLPGIRWIKADKNLDEAEKEAIALVGKFLAGDEI